jgi:hypothetical protein
MLLPVGINVNAVRAGSPTANDYRPKANKSINQHLYEARIPQTTIVDIGYKAGTLPDYSINTYSPRIPKPTAKIHYNPPRISLPASSFPSSTALLMQQAQALTNYLR